jgi:hypothetical protein
MRRSGSGERRDRAAPVPQSQDRAHLVSSAMAKLDVHDRTTLATRARDAGLA